MGVHDLVRRQGIIALIVCTAMLASIGITGCTSQQTVQEKPLLTVTTDQAKMTSLSELMAYSGIAKGQAEAVIMPEISGKVTSVNVSAGDKVYAGQVLYTLDSSTYDAAVAQASAGVNQAATGVDAALARVIQAQAAVEQAQAAKKVNDVQVEQARLNYERTQALFDAGAASQTQLDTAKAAYDQAQAGVPEAAIAAAEAGVDAAISGVESSQAAVGVAEAGLNSAQTQANKCLIVSPIDGTVGNLQLTVGNTASPAGIAAIVSDLSMIEVAISVGEAEINYMQTGSEVDVLVKAVREQAFVGRVVSVSPLSDPLKKTFTVKVVIDNPGNLIKSGMFAQVKAKTVSKRDVLCVPLSAVVPRGARSVVYILDKDNHAHEKEVETGISNDVIIEITKGLDPGQVVVTKGNTLLSEGALVRVASQEAK